MRYPSTAESGRLSLLCETSLTRSPLLYGVRDLPNKYPRPSTGYHTPTLYLNRAHPHFLIRLTLCIINDIIYIYAAHVGYYGGWSCHHVCNSHHFILWVCLFSAHVIVCYSHQPIYLSSPKGRGAQTWTWWWIEQVVLLMHIQQFLTHTALSNQMDFKLIDLHPSKIVGIGWRK